MKRARIGDGLPRRPSIHIEGSRDYVDSLCVRVGTVCGLDSGVGQVRHPKDGSTVATAIRTIVVLAFSWLMVFIVGSQERLSAISEKTLLFLILSGLATGAKLAVLFPRAADRRYQ